MDLRVVAINSLNWLDGVLLRRWRARWGHERACHGIDLGLGSAGWESVTREPWWDSPPAHQHLAGTSEKKWRLGGLREAGCFWVLGPEQGPFCRWYRGHLCGGLVVGGALSSRSSWCVLVCCLAVRDAE